MRRRTLEPLRRSGAGFGYCRRVPAPRVSLADLLAGALPGVLGGLLTVGLVYFLNTNLELELVSVLRASLLYGAALGAVSALMVTLISRGRRERVTSYAVWGVCAVLCGGAALYWAHASRFAYYLPTGINQRLLKTGFWLACSGLGCFYIALSHTVGQRPYGRRGRIAVLALAVLAVLVVAERRASYRQPPSTEPAKAALEARRPPRLCVIGLDTASLDALLPLAEQGQVPALAALLHRGSYARLKTLSPTWRLPAWTTLSTGKYPFKHGLLSPQVLLAPAFGSEARLRLLPQWMGFERWGRFGNTPAASDSAGRRARALWEIIADEDRPSTVVAWPASAPLGKEVSGGATDRFFGANGGRAEDVVPASAALSLAELRRSPSEIAGELRGVFGPDASAVLLNAAVADRWRAGVAETLLAREELRDGGLWLFLRGLGNVSGRLYGGYAAARQEGSQEPADLRAAQAVTTYYRYADALIERVLSRGGFDLVAVVSAHGVNGPSGWRRALALLASSRSLAGRSDDAPDGLLLLVGNGVKPGLIAEARLVDVAPTLLYALGMPIADDLDGRVLTDAFSEEFLARQPLSFLPTYERPRP